MAQYLMLSEARMQASLLHAAISTVSVSSVLFSALPPHVARGGGYGAGTTSSHAAERPYGDRGKGAERKSTNSDVYDAGHA
ncbi:hypothetical protein DOTSEDRAFT_44886 [Dothistroma septosporum NZE10]|uniref:Uncharacterized protein n=1 Tax=Dothistroma septosporum (strain NZE10 / CBS 128990) TaxID=675120 RepID=N1PQR6_DOTSN|nr:hypothetical protein DOTSEDRAFT_44886 [Dothistroma septosporum NZE10]